MARVYDLLYTTGIRRHAAGGVTFFAVKPVAVCSPLGHRQICTRLTLVPTPAHKCVVYHLSAREARREMCVYPAGRPPSYRAEQPTIRSNPLAIYCGAAGVEQTIRPEIAADSVYARSGLYGGAYHFGEVVVTVCFQVCFGRGICVRIRDVADVGRRKYKHYSI